MNKQILPDENDWDNFWKLDSAKRFTRTSWSKKRICRILDLFVGKDKKVLDAGCGSGFFSKYFCDKGAKVFSLDYSDEALQIAKRITNGKTEVLKKDLLSPNISADIHEKFDLIFTDGLFEHFSSGEQDIIFNNLFSMISSEGVIVTFVPNKFSPWELIRPFYMPGIKEAPFVLSGLVELNERNGAKIIYKGGLNVFPFALSPDNLFGHLFGMLLFTIAKK
ncbi:MAG: hypothetical protein A2Y03_08125 [Omnitrophica WOR_2 bacterium GWF2_38_59]|nr:MAG: hypothetical protein A2Y06_00100 [Omnitrophica WOR_2 bacterium GWA2_37_7]OGX26118.1 MAG: hypothetical protein A2Y03_08125 [Omnitrophica WOR_2 bacterium GWF2_38_59]OGX48926.1 MAG: hypothetical protein A2243_06560 [Omnitrophica WOR_2 bacterium RIFOXYA2_FULL_38_17]OGX52755.1 MAG: hypothetical protein A2267_10995 [Omnitrophica WOR_2 bacterium RIFOXYA12_FULL_38_10]OGX55756.1 MAG: hypothetical protein A2447_12365 [Omnitrophica WOR_2 bacterium RIFOXYC2_FULL_38_12]OGX57524.1 MAG: hypothetical 